MTAPAARSTLVDQDTTGRALFGVLLVVGIALRVRQLLENAPLWLDELALTNGVLSGPLTGLFDGPSDFAQVAPPGFLVLEWLLYHAAPSSDVVVRLPAFAFSIGSIWVTWIAARELVGERHAWVAAGLVALAGPLVFMSAQVKPYAADAFLASWVVGSLLIYDRKPTKERLKILKVAGAIAPFFSLGIVFVLGGAGLYLLARGWRSNEWKGVAMVGTWWASGALASVLLTRGLVSEATDRLMLEYWSASFPSFPRTVADLWWPFRVILEQLWTLMGLRGVRVVGVGLLMACVLAWQHQKRLLLLFVAPIVAAYVAALLNQYPFGSRLMHWTVPLLALLLTILVAEVANQLQSVWRPSSVIPGLAALAAPALTIFTSPPPYLREDIRHAIEKLAEVGRPDDVLYLSWGAWHSWHRYGKDVTTLGRIVQGGCPIDYPRGYLSDLDQLRGRDGVWVLFARMQYEEVHRMMLDYLQAIGTRTDSMVINLPGLNMTARIDLHRFDLNDSARLASASAETFPVPAGFTRTETGCARIDAMVLRADGTRVAPLIR